MLSAVCCTVFWVTAGSLSLVNLLGRSVEEGFLFFTQTKPTQNTNFTEIHPICDFRFFENTKITQFTKIIDQASINNENKLIIVLRDRRSVLIAPP